MNIRLLIVGIWAFFIVSCSTISETANYEYKNHSINVISDSISDDSFRAILEPYRLQVESKMSEVIGETEDGLVSYRPESPLSNFLSDMILDEAVKYCSESQNGIVPQVSLYNHGGIRASLPKGEIKISNAFELMPFENELVLVLLSGQQLIDLANYITTRGGEGVAGITFGMYHNVAENIKVQGLKLDVEKKYWLVTSDYIANGGDGMTVLTWAEKRISTGLKMRDVIISNLRDIQARGEIIRAKSDGRIYNVE